MDFIGNNSNNRSCPPDSPSPPAQARNCAVGSHTIFLVQFLDFESKLSLLHNLIVEFVPSADCCILRSRECCQGMEIKAVYNQTQEIGDPQDRRACERVVEQGYTVHVEIRRSLRDVTFALSSRLACQLGGGCTAHYESPPQWRSVQLA